jgi:hypothetical protein
MNLILILAAAASVTANYDCSVANIQAVDIRAGTVSGNPINGLPKEALSFRLSLDGANATVAWPDSPIQMNGREPIVSTSPGSGMSLFLSAGPCLFTETNCGTLFNYATQPDGSVQFIATPSAVATDQGTEVRHPFLVMINGQCALAGEPK